MQLVRKPPSTPSVADSLATSSPTSSCLSLALQSPKPVCLGGSLSSGRCQSVVKAPALLCTPHSQAWTPLPRPLTPTLTDLLINPPPPQYDQSLEEGFRSSFSAYLSQYEIILLGHEEEPTISSTPGKLSLQPCTMAWALSQSLETACLRQLNSFLCHFLWAQPSGGSQLCGNKHTQGFLSFSHLWTTSL